jgi:hypothetical protein
MFSDELRIFFEDLKSVEFDIVGILFVVFLSESFKFKLIIQMDGSKILILSLSRKVPD